MYPFGWEQIVGITGGPRPILFAGQASRFVFRGARRVGQRTRGWTVLQRDQEFGVLRPDTTNSRPTIWLSSISQQFEVGGVL